MYAIIVIKPARTGPVVGPYHPAELMSFTGL
jgi:hypothetical protein